MKYDLDEGNITMIIHAISMELHRLNKLRSNAESVKIFDEIYGEQLKALEETKSIFNI